MTTASTGSGLGHVIGPDGVFSIRLRDGDIRLRAIEGDTIRIRDRHDRDLTGMFAIVLGQGSASLRAGHLAGRRNGGGEAPDLAVGVPRRATVVVEAGSAEIDVDGLAGDQRYRTASGDMTLRAVSGQIVIEVVSGDVDIRATGETAATIRTVSGDVELRAGTLTALEAATTSGDLRIAGRLAGPGPFSIVTVSGDTLFAPVGDIRIEMATLSGGLRSDLGGRSEGGRGRRSLEVGSGGSLVTLRSLSGDLRVVPPSPVEDSEPSLVDDARSQPAAHAADADPASVNRAIAVANDEARLRILRALERAEIGVAEASRRLEALDGGEPMAAEPPTGTTEHVDDRSTGDAIDPATQTDRFDPSARSDA
ncbi:MAG: DUF4097 family beta strand repeat-containing protein [Chloroflexota bacterium]